jgi:hypothetical protein
MQYAWKRRELHRKLWLENLKGSEDVDWIHMAGSCEHGNEHSGSTI